MSTNFIARRNVSVSLGVASCIGVIATAVTAVLDTKKYIKKLEKNQGDISKKTKAKLIVSSYIRTCIVASASVATGLSSTVLSANTQTKLAAAIVVAGESMNAYRNEVRRRYGMEEEKDIHETSVKLVRRNGNSKLFGPCYINDELIDDKAEQITFYDPASGHIFERTIEEVLRAENAVNRSLAITGECPFRDYYEFLNDGHDDIQITGDEAKKIDSYLWDRYTTEIHYGVFYLDFWHSEETIITDTGEELSVIAIHCDVPPHRSDIDINDSTALEDGFTWKIF